MSSRITCTDVCIVGQLENLHSCTELVNWPNNEETSDWCWSIIAVLLLLFPVNSVCFAPHELGLLLACGSSDGSISVISTTGLHLFSFAVCVWVWIVAALMAHLRHLHHRSPSFVFSCVTVCVDVDCGSSDGSISVICTTGLRLLSLAVWLCVWMWIVAALMTPSPSSAPQVSVFCL